VRHGVIIITYPLHISHIFQVLDVLLFGVLKRAKKYQRRDDSLASNIDHVRQLCQAYKTTTTRTMIRYTEARTGLGYQARDNTTSLVVEEDRIPLIDGFRGISQFDSHPNQLSRKRAAQKWECINQHLAKEGESDGSALETGLDSDQSSESVVISSGSKAV
jgi:hypothetical protein